MSGTFRALAVFASFAGMLIDCDSAMPSQNASRQASLVKPASDSAAAPEDDQDGVMSEHPKISVEMLGPLSSLKGHEWPRGYDWVRNKPDQPMRQILANRPHELVILLPSGRTIRHVSKGTFFKQEGGTVIRASLMPHLGPSLGYQDAIAVVEAVLREWDAEPNEGTRMALAEWKAEGDVAPHELGKRGGGAVLRGEDKVGISFEIRSTLSNGGWFATIDVAATLEAERKLWGMPEAPASQPTTSP